MSLITHRVRININGKKIRYMYIKKIHLIINIENEIDATFSLLIFIIVYLMKNYGELIGIIVPSLMHQATSNQ